MEVVVALVREPVANHYASLLHKHKTKVLTTDAVGMVAAFRGMGIRKTRSPNEKRTTIAPHNKYHCIPISNSFIFLNSPNFMCFGKGKLPTAHAYEALCRTLVREEV